MKQASRAFRLVHEDHHVVVVDKAPGFLSVPTDKRERRTVVDELSRYLSRSDRITKRAVVVHRLDRETAGLMVFAKDERSGHALERVWQADVVRRYGALVHGEVAFDARRLVSRLVTTTGAARRSSADGAGEEAVTEVTVLERVRGASLVDVNILTGRRHQIRVQLADAGHPLLGDPRYQRERTHPAWREERLALFARLLSFPHPATGERLTFELPLPALFSAFLTKARASKPPGRPAVDEAKPRPPPREVGAPARATARTRPQHAPPAQAERAMAPAPRPPPTKAPRPAAAPAPASAPAAPPTPSSAPQGQPVSSSPPTASRPKRPEGPRARRRRHS